MKTNKQKFMHYAFQTILYSVGVGTAGAIIFTFITIFERLWETLV